LVGRVALSGGRIRPVQCLECKTSPPTLVAQWLTDHLMLKENTGNQSKADKTTATERCARTHTHTHTHTQDTHDTRTSTHHRQTDGQTDRKREERERERGREGEREKEKARERERRGAGREGKCVVSLRRGFAWGSGWSRAMLLGVLVVLLPRLELLRLPLLLPLLSQGPAGPLKCARPG